MLDRGLGIAGREDGGNGSKGNNQATERGMWGVRKLALDGIPRASY